MSSQWVSDIAGLLHAFLSQGRYRMDKKGNYVVGMLKHVKAMSDTSECEFLPRMICLHVGLDKRSLHLCIMAENCETNVTQTLDIEQSSLDSAAKTPSSVQTQGHHSRLVEALTPLPAMTLYVTGT